MEERVFMRIKGGNRAIPKLLMVCLLVSAIMIALPGRAAFAATITYQAESATLSQAVVATNHAGFTGSGFADYNNVAGSYVEFTVNVATPGNATLAFRYANGTTANRPMSISVNGTVVNGSLAFNPTGAWSTWATQSLTAALNAGSNKVRATATTANGGPNVDKLDVTDGGDTTPPTVPGNPRTSNLTCNSVTFSWNA